MDRVNSYQDIVKNILQTLSKRVPNNRPSLRNHLIISDENDEYILILNGWHNDKHYYNIIAHIEINNGKILIHEESIDPSLYERLTDTDVPEQDIIPVYLRKMEFA